MIIRKATSHDRGQIVELYRSVSDIVQGISRRPDEITETYIYSLLSKSDNDIVFLVAVDDDGKIIGCSHGVKNGLKKYDHILSDVTIIVSIEHQREGLGKMLGLAFLKHVVMHRPDIKRVEMEVLKDFMLLDNFFEAGFVKEGEINGRIRNEDGSFSDSILLMWENPKFQA